MEEMRSTIVSNQAIELPILPNSRQLYDPSKLIFTVIFDNDSETH